MDNASEFERLPDEEGLTVLEQLKKDAEALIAERGVLMPGEAAVTAVALREESGDEITINHRKRWPRRSVLVVQIVEHAGNHQFGYGPETFDKEFRYQIRRNSVRVSESWRLNVPIANELAKKFWGDIDQSFLKGIVSQTRKQAEVSMNDTSAPKRPIRRRKREKLKGKSAEAELTAVHKRIQAANAN